MHRQDNHSEEVFENLEPVVLSYLSQPSENEMESELSYDPFDYSSKKLSAELIHFLRSKETDMALEGSSSDLAPKIQILYPMGQIKFGLKF